MAELWWKTAPRDGSKTCLSLEIDYDGGYWGYRVKRELWAKYVLTARTQADSYSVDHTHTHTHQNLRPRAAAETRPVFLAAAQKALSAPFIWLPCLSLLSLNPLLFTPSLSFHPAGLPACRHLARLILPPVTPQPLLLFFPTLSVSFFPPHFWTSFLFSGEMPRESGGQQFIMPTVCI